MEDEKTPFYWIIFFVALSAAISIFFMLVQPYFKELALKAINKLILKLY